MRNWRELLRRPHLAACGALMAALIVPMPGLAASMAAPQRIELTPALEATLRESVDISTLVEQRSQRNQPQRKLSQILLDAERTSLSATGDLQGRVSLPTELLEGDRILVEIWHSDANRSFHSTGLPALNATIRHQGGNGAPTEAWVPASRMSELAALPGVNRVSPARLVQHLAGAQNTQGVSAGNVPPWHAASLDGNGVTIAIIDSFNNTSGQVAALQASGDWPPSSRLTTVKIGTGTFGNNGVNHGNAVLEIAYDVAPGATYIAYDTRTLGDWRAAIDQAVAAGANIISASLGAPLDGIGDGTALPGSVAERVEAAAAAGVLYFNAAGNEREAHWGGLYNGSGTTFNSYQDVHLWDGVNNLNLIPYCLPAGYPVQVTLHWDDWTNVNHDYDMILYRRNSTNTSWAQVASSIFDQNGGAGQTPQEFVQFTASGSSGGFGGCPGGTSVYAVLVARWNAPTAKNLQVFADGLGVFVPSRSLGFPADSTAAITVAALNVTNSVQESYSSEGPILAPGGGLPTGTEFPKPDLSSFANVNTVSYGVGAFNGTSAATPHVAGMAALLKQRHPAYTRNQLAQLMRDISAQGANDLGSAGFDFQHGHGRLRFQQESALVVTQQPLDTDVNDAIPEVLVEVRDTENLRVLSGPTAAIAVAIEDDPSSGSAVLSGTSPASVDAGISSYADLSIDVAGNDYTLMFTATGLTSAESNAFDILATAIDGVCGTANGGTFTTAPATNLCATGTASAVSGSGPWTWTCSGSAGGSDANCSANIQTYNLTYSAGTGGSISGATSQNVPHGGSGTAITVTPDSGYSFTQWSDASTDNPRIDVNVMADITVQAQFTQNPVDGVCGTANGGTFTTAPATNLCATGTASAVNGSGPWTWTCSGSAGGSDANCSANIQTYSLTYTADTGGSISGTTSQTVAHGGNGTPVEAVANSGYQFVQWSDSSLTNPRTDTNVTTSISVTAEFELAAPSDFTPGNVVVYRVGTGVSSLSSAASAVFLDEYDAVTGALVQSIPLPTAADAGNNACTASGTATSEGMMTRSTDRRHLVGTCYSATPGTAAVAGTTSASVPRVVFLVDHATSIDTTTALTAFANASNPRSAASDGVNLWVAGNGNTVSGVPTGGVHLVTTLGGSASTQISSAVTNTRNATIYDGQLFISHASGSTSRIGSVGTGTPTTTGQPITSLPGYPTSTGSPYAYLLVDLDEGVSGNDTLYVADDSSGLLKYSLVGGSWVDNGKIGVSSDQYRGLTGVAHEDGSVTLFATRKGNEFVKVIDIAGYNATIDGTPTIIATGSTGFAYRGVAFAPEAVVMHEVTSSVGSGLGDIDPLGIQIVSDGSTTSFTVTPAAGWHVDSVTGCGGTWSGSNPYTTAPITADCEVIANFVQTPVDGVCGAADGGTFTIAPTTDLCAAGTASSLSGSGPWTWTCSGIAGGSDASCSANIQTYSLIYTADTGGSISGNASQTVAHGGNGTPVEAVANSGYTFTQWSDASTANPRTDSNVTANISVQAQFTQDPVNGTCGTANGGTFTTAPATNLCATGTASAVSGSGPWTWTCAGIAGGSDASCSANIQTYSLIYTADTGGSISGNASQTVAHGGNGTPVEAVANSGYTFTQWSDASTANPRTDSNVTANISVQAQFTQDPVNGTCGTANGGTFTTAPATNLCATGTASAVSGSGPWTWTCAGIAGGSDASCSANIQTYSLIYTADTGGSISGNASQTVAHGGNGTPVEAVANSGYTFTQWSDASTANPRTDSNVTANISVQAQFSINTYPISVSVDPVAGGTASCSPNPVAHGSATVCTVNPASGWSVDTVSGNTCTPVDNGNGTWTASNITESCGISVTFRNSVFDAAIHKTVTHSLVLLDDSGDLVRFEIIVSNTGLDPISDAEVLDLLPEEFDPASWTCEGISGGLCTNASGTGDIAEFVDLPVGASVRFIIEGLVAPVPENGVLNAAEVVVEDDADTSDNADRVWYQRCGAMNLQTDSGDETLLPHLCIFQDGYEEP